MKIFASFAICCSAIFACASDPPIDEPPASGGETQQAIEPDTQQDEVTQSIACPPAAAGDTTTACIQQFEEGDDDAHWYTPIWPFPWTWHHGHKAKWICDVSCNVQPTEPGARCPDRVTGKGIGTSSDSACKAAKNDADSKLPRKCYKRHCNCRCTKGT